MARRFLLTLDQQFPDRKFKQDLKDSIDLSTANLSITSSKTRSELLNYWIVLDKLEIKLDHKIYIEDLLSYFNEKDFNYSYRKLNNNCHSYYCKGVYFVYGYHSFGKISSIFLNPFGHSNLQEALNTLVDVTPIDCLKSYNISRVDICLMIFDRCYQEVKESLWVGYKHNIELIRRAPIGVQSQYHGEKPKKVLLYDKLAKDPHFNINHTKLQKFKHHIRCEIQLSREEVPAKKLEELIPSLLDKKFNPFKFIKYQQIKFKTPSKNAKDSIWERFYEIKTLTRHIGIQYASSSIKLFTDNYDRNYRRAFIRPEWTIEFRDTYHNKISQFISGNMEV